VLDHILLEARRILGSDTSAIYQLQIPGNTFVTRTVQGSPEIAIADLDTLPAISQALRDGEPVTAPDVTKLPASPAWTSGTERACTNCGAMLAVPLIVQGEVYGSLALYYSGPRDIADEETRLAVAFADQAALAIENARLREQVTQAAVLEERARLARELHDSVTQGLFSMTLLAEAGQRLAGSGDLERVQAYLSRLGETSQQSLKEMRLLVFELRPLALESMGLVGALQQRLDAVEARAGVETRLLVEGTVQVPAEIEEHLYRIAEQALNNALKHAAATLVTVRLDCTEVRVTLTSDLGTSSRHISHDHTPSGAGYSPVRVAFRRMPDSLSVRCARPLAVLH
jgi:signal transduction histidine kinase